MKKSINTHAIIQKGERIYSKRLKTKLEKKYFGKIVAIDPDTGDYFIGDTILIHCSKNPILQQSIDPTLDKFCQSTRERG